jgi:hypothetical protein
MTRGTKVHTLRGCEVRNPDKVKSAHCRARTVLISAYRRFEKSRKERSSGILRTSTCRHWKPRNPEKLISVSSILGGQVAEIQGSREGGRDRRNSQGKSPKVGCSKSRVAKCREPSRENIWKNFKVGPA